MNKTTFTLLLVYIITLSCQTKKQEKKEIPLNKYIPHRLDANYIAKKALAIDLIMQERAEHGFSGNVLVVQKNQKIFQHSYGQAQQHDSVLNTAETRFQLASISKTFTAVAVMILIENGKLRLNQTVQDFFPKFPYKNITIYSLLTHRSGLPFYQYTFDKLVRKNNLFPVNSNIMTWFANSVPIPPIFNQPNKFFSYNNTNYVILASIIEKVSGMSYHKFIQKNIFGPLGMSHSFVILPNTDLKVKTIASGHQFGGKLPTDWYDYVYGDKGIYTTLGDLLKYYQGLRDAKILKISTVQDMWQPRSFEKPGSRNYGYGFRLGLDSAQNVRTVFHTGWWKGFNTMFFTVPKEDILIVILGNKYNHAAYDIKPIWALLSKNVLQDKEETETDQK